MAFVSWSLQEFDGDGARCTEVMTVGIDHGESTHRGAFRNLQCRCRG